VEFSPHHIYTTRHDLELHMIHVTSLMREGSVQAQCLSSHCRRGTIQHDLCTV